LDTKALLLAIASAVLAFPIVWLAQRWAVNRWVSRFMADVMARTSTSGGRLTLKLDDLPRLEPEADFVVHVSDTGATCSRPDGKTESVQWSDLERVEILTTDDGPFAPDQFWVLSGSKGGCVVPWGATGERELMTRLQALAGFRNDVIVGAASLTTNNLLLCWQRTQQDAEQRDEGERG
jgi:hypothetical protein